jgi:hypothetical protein
MATILYTWELGGGWGHTTVAFPILRRLHEQEPKVVAVLRDLSRAETLVAGQAITCLQAPLPVASPAAQIDVLRTVSHVLHNSGSLSHNLPRTVLGGAIDSPG